MLVTFAAAECFQFFHISDLPIGDLPIKPSHTQSEKRSTSSKLMTYLNMIQCNVCQAPAYCSEPFASLFFFLFCFFYAVCIKAYDMAWNS